MKTLLAVDGNNIINRAYYGIRPMTNTAGMPTNAVYGMVTMLRKQIEDFNPDMCAIAFDLPKPTFRHKMYEGYKGTRKPMDEALAVQFPYAVRAAKALGFKVIEVEGYEADDILGTLSARCDSRGDRTLLLTGDRDCFQLISDTTSVLYPGKNEYTMFTPEVYEAKYGVKPCQVVDLKALMGDSSDNIPGVPGIGEKGAVELLNKYETLDAIYASGFEGIKPGTVKKLEAGRDSAYMSKTLATICREAPGVPELDELDYNGPDMAQCRELFCELDFLTFIKRFGLDATEVENTSGTEKKEIHCSQCIEDFTALVNKGCAVSVLEGNISASDGENCVTVPADEMSLKALADNASKLCCWDCKSLYEYSDGLGVKLRGIGFDTMLAAYVCDLQTGSEFDKAVTAYLSQVCDSKTPQAVYIAAMRPVLEEKLGTGAFRKLFEDIEMPLAAVLADMEEEGFRVDTEGLAQYGKVLEDNAEALKARIYFAAGEEFNINSPKQLGEILFEKMGLPSGKKKKSGYSTGADILEKLAPEYPIVDDILEYRKLTKLCSTYVVGLRKEADGEGRIHTSFRQTGTVTGRLSSAEPNLQNIPIRTEEGRLLRRYFLPRPGHLLIDADYSQIELRLLAAISGDENMINAFNSGADIHTSTASAVFGVPMDAVTPELRKRAKAVNFGIVYGIGEYSLSEDIGSTVKQAREYIQSYLAGYPGVDAYLKDIVAKAKKDGYVDTLCGRRRYIPEISASNFMQRQFGERVAMNSPIQGTAADIIKIAMINVSERLKKEGLDARLILQIHDELIVDSARECAEQAAAILREEMESAVSLPVKLTVELTTGEKWLED